MATLIELDERGLIHKLDAGLSWRQQENRLFYAFPKAQKWMLEALPLEISQHDLEIAPLEQLDAFLCLYCAGDELEFERQFHALRHIDKGVWELKTADLRLFGWFAVKNCFVCTNGNMAYRVKLHKLYSAYRDEAVRLRDQLNLNEPKFVTGDNPNDVISNFRFPTS